MLLLDLWAVRNTDRSHVAFHQGLHYLLRLKQTSGKDVHHNLENSTCDLLKYKTGIPILIVSICMGQMVKIYERGLWKTFTGLGKEMLFKVYLNTPGSKILMPSQCRVAIMLAFSIYFVEHKNNF